MTGSVDLFSKLFNCVAVCSAVMLLIRSSDAARVKIPPAQEENGGRPDTWSQLYQPHISDRSHQFAKDPHPIWTENGPDADDERQNGNPYRKDPLLTYWQPTQPSSSSTSYDRGSSDDRHVHFQPRTLRGKSGSGTNVVRSPTRFHNTYSHHRAQANEGQWSRVKPPPSLPTQAPSTIKMSSASGRQQSAPSSDDSTQKLTRSGSLSGGYRPVLHKASPWGNLTDVRVSQHKSSLWSSVNPNDIPGTYSQGKAPQIKQLVSESQRHDQSNDVVPKPVLQSSDSSLFSSQRNGNSRSPQTAATHDGSSLSSRTSTHTSEFALPRTWTASDGIQSGHFPVIADHRTVSHAPSVSKSSVSSIKRLSPHSETESAQVTDVYGAHPPSNNEELPYRRVQSYLFKDPQISSVRREMVNGDEEKPGNEISTSFSLSVKSPPSSLVYRRNPSLNQERSSHTSSEVQQPSINSNTLHGGLGYSSTDSAPSRRKTFSKPPSVLTANTPPSPSTPAKTWKPAERSATAPTVLSQVSFDPDGKKPAVRSSVNTPQSTEDSKPLRSVKNSHGFRGLQHQPQWSNHDEKDSSRVPFSSKKNANAKADSQPHVFNRNTDHQMKRVTSSSPVLQKYHFGQRRGAAAKTPQAQTERTPAGHANLSTFRKAAVNEVMNPVLQNSASTLQDGSFWESKFKASANVFASPRRPARPKSSPPPTGVLDEAQAVPVPTPRSLKPGVKAAQPAPSENNATLGYNSDPRRRQDSVGSGAAGGFPAGRSAGSKQKEGAKASDMSAIKTSQPAAVKADLAGFRFSSLKSRQPKGVVSPRRYDPFSLKAVHDPNPGVNRESSVQDVLTAVGKDVKAEVISQSGSIWSVPDSSGPPEHKTLADRSTSPPVSKWEFKPELSILGPAVKPAAGDDGITSKSDVSNHSAHKRLQTSHILGGKAFSDPQRARWHGGDQGSKVISSASFPGSHLGSGADKMAPAEAKPVLTSSMSAPDLNMQTGKDIKPSPKKTGGVRLLVNKLDEHKKKWKSFDFLGFPSSRNKTNKRPWRYEERRMTMSMAAPRDPSARPKSAGGLRLLPSLAESTQKQRSPGFFKTSQMDETVLGVTSPTTGMAQGKLVKEKPVQKGSGVTAANATSLTDNTRAVPITRTSRRPLRVEAFTYEDVPGITSFSGIRTATQRRNVTATVQPVSNVTDSIGENTGALGKEQLRLRDLDRYSGEKDATTSIVHPGQDEAGGGRDGTEGELGDFIAVDRNKLGVESGEDGGRRSEDGKPTPVGGNYVTAGQETGATSGPVLETEEGSGGATETDVSLPVSSDASEKSDAPGGAMLELDYLRTSVGDISLKSVNLS